MKIGIFGGSFNPVHNAHINIANFAIETLELDKFYFVPTFKSPFKKNEKSIDIKHRIKMLELSKPEKSEISLFEVKRKGVSYTIDTIKYFQKKYPNSKLYLFIGSDNLPKLNKWKNIKEISEIAKIIVFKRSKNINKINLKKYNCKLLNNKIYEISSTQVKKGDFSFLNPKVNEYIAENYLYIDDILKNTQEAKRHKHSIAAGNLAAKYAQNLKLNVKEAWFAGLCHDITKNWTLEKHRMFLKQNNIDDKKIKDYQLHQLTGSLWLKNVYKLKNENIIKAISVHTSLAKNLSLLDKVVFMADKLCQGRKFEGIQKIRKLSFENFEEAFKLIVKKTKNFNLSKTDVSKEQLEIYNYLIEK
ncbi:nicotinate-nucleotide adenylyltransferase [Mesomycoplasma neurolyticum]|uniref:Probable nicotinate-nucleotide adenylyltransferase n=1 Tax=Mesomycoplasma neurolyticum TaxID=2120 RepID=A0A449A5C8_9BACT|nr:nicotinate-nucleotide adenylyltransferase [Mesomycoplasma neurolyticum]VEU59432.1 Probable nicotinate-nucleotide adenylyltransferase [Mesomycoplasma neurolyticum]